MKYCDITYCEAEAFKTVPVSVNRPADEKRRFCAACEEAYTIGCQHGRMEARADLNQRGQIIENNLPLRAFVEKMAKLCLSHENEDFDLSIYDEMLKGEIRTMDALIEEARKLVKP